MKSENGLVAGHETAHQTKAKQSIGQHSADMQVNNVIFEPQKEA
jgi:hypothetical protein